MSVLFIGPYRQQDGWGMAAQSYIKAVATQVRELTSRPIFLAGNGSNQLDNDILGYENSFYHNYDIVIQKTLPHCLFYDGRFKKNIGLFMLETNNISNSICVQTVNQMDEVWVPSEQEKKCLIKSGITKPIKAISQPLDIETLNKNLSYKIDFNPVVNRTFKFYFIGEYVERKNIKDLITAFHLAFDINQPVSLILKTSIPGMSSGESLKIIEKDLNEVKQKLNISQRYKKEIIITEKLPYTDIIGLHNACDCLISPSYGESFCRPVAEALCLGKTPIVTDNTGMIDYINNNNGFIVNSHKTPVVIDQRTLSKDFDIYNANEFWYKINLYDLIEKMKTVYQMHKENRKKLEEKRAIGLSSTEQFSYTTIGKKLCI